MIVIVVVVVVVVVAVRSHTDHCNSISGRVVEYIVAIDVARVRFPADAIYCNPTYFVGVACVNACSIVGSKSNHRGAFMLLKVTAVGLEHTPLRTGA